MAAFALIDIRVPTSQPGNLASAMTAWLSAGTSHARMLLTRLEAPHPAGLAIGEVIMADVVFKNSHRSISKNFAEALERIPIFEIGFEILSELVPFNLLAAGKPLYPR